MADVQNRENLQDMKNLQDMDKIAAKISALKNRFDISVPGFEDQDEDQDTAGSKKAHSEITSPEKSGLEKFGLEKTGLEKSSLEAEKAFLQVRNRQDLLFVIAAEQHAVPFITWLRDIESYTHLVFFTAVDFIEEGMFQLTYMLHNYQLHHDIAVLVMISREEPVMESIHHLWPHAATYQQELFEMFGIEFPGSPRLYEDFALEGWQDTPPMRREFDTRAYSEETYFPRPGRKTFDTVEYMKEQLYPGEAESW